MSLILGFLLGKMGNSLDNSIDESNKKAKAKIKASKDYLETLLAPYNGVKEFTVKVDKPELVEHNVLDYVSDRVGIKSKYLKYHRNGYGYFISCSNSFESEYSSFYIMNIVRLGIILFSTISFTYPIVLLLGALFRDVLSSPLSGWIISAILWLCSVMVAMLLGYLLSILVRYDRSILDFKIIKSSKEAIDGKN